MSSALETMLKGQNAVATTEGLAEARTYEAVTATHFTGAFVGIDELQLRLPHADVDDEKSGVTNGTVNARRLQVRSEAIGDDDRGGSLQSHVLYPYYELVLTTAKASCP